MREHAAACTTIFQIVAWLASGCRAKERAERFGKSFYRFLAGATAVAPHVALGRDCFGGGRLAMTFSSMIVLSPHGAIRGLNSQIKASAR
jgi:hypothetical protein